MTQADAPSRSRILVVDDEPEIVRAVKAYLEQAGFNVLTAFDGESALHAIRRDAPDLAVLDVMLPDRDGWELTRLVRADPQLRALPIILLTARIDDTDKIVGLELGADDYITKPFNPREVVARVRALLRRQHLSRDASGSEVLQLGDLLLDLGRRELLLDGVPVMLTPTEFGLLHIFMKHPGQALSRAARIKRALGSEYEGIERTLDSHIRNLRRKIEADPGRPSYIQTVFGLGYRMVGPPRAPGGEGPLAVRRDRS
ncbi:MAG: response regulator transcription factor [Ardenticatenia bacterium]|nr:response regulator transcription factor [Ardenticatenia bacterium]